jgi:hypothetical protein
VGEDSDTTDEYRRQFPKIVMESTKEIKIIKGYLKHYQKWKYYDFSIGKQRELILKEINEIKGWDEKHIEEVMPYAPFLFRTEKEEIYGEPFPDDYHRYGDDLLDPESLLKYYREKRGEVSNPEVWIDLHTGGNIVHDTKWMRKLRKDFSDEETKGKIIWYFDTGHRGHLKELIIGQETNEEFYSADFTANYASHHLKEFGVYDYEPDVLCKESTKEAIFYQTIFEKVMNKENVREIAMAVSTGDMSISYIDIINLKKNASLDFLNFY